MLHQLRLSPGTSEGSTDAREREREIEPAPDTRVLRDEELDSVSGGKRELRELVVVHKIDKASPVLL